MSSSAPPHQHDSHGHFDGTPSPEPQLPTWNPTSLADMCAAAVRGALQYGRMPLPIIKRLSNAQCHVLVEHSALTGLPPQLVLALERCNRSLIDLNYDYWQSIWQTTCQSSSVTCRQVENEVAALGVEVTYRDLYLKFLAFTESRKARLASALKAKREAAAAAAAAVSAMSSSSFSRMSTPKVGNVNLVSARSAAHQTQKRSWNSPAAPSSIMDKVRSKVRKTSTATTVHQQQRTAVAVLRKKEEEKASQMPVLQMKPRPRPPSPPRRGGTAQVKELRNPSEAVAEHVRRVMREREDRKEGNDGVSRTQQVRPGQLNVGRGAASKVTQGGGLLKALGID